MNQLSDISVTLRRRWNDPRSARVPLSALRERDKRVDGNAQMRAALRSQPR